MKKETVTIDAIKKAFAEYANAQGMRKTPERFVVIEVIAEIDGKFTVDEVKAKTDELLKMSRVTVYNTVEMLVRAGLVVKHAAPRGAYHYEACFDNSPRHHLVCNMCGRRFVFNDPAMEYFLAQRPYKRFKMTRCMVTVFGMCSACQAKQTRQKNKLAKEKAARERSKKKQNKTKNNNTQQTIKKSQKHRQT